MLNQKGLAPIILIIIIVLVFGIGVFVLGIVKIPKSSKTSPTSLKIESPLKDQYQNPFRKDQSSSYSNPFENLK